MGISEKQMGTMKIGRALEIIRDSIDIISGSFFDKGIEGILTKDLGLTVVGLGIIGIELESIGGSSLIMGKKRKGKAYNENGKTDKPNDKVFTPRHISKQIIDLFDIQGTILDPFKGDGSFYDQFPEHLTRYYCEIDEGIDFFKFDKKVDWIISNPPYSIFDDVMEHSVKLADNIVYLLPLNKVFSSMGRIRRINAYGGIVSMWILGASKCGFPFGFPACAFYFKRDYKGETKMIIDGDKPKGD